MPFIPNPLCRSKSLIQSLTCSLPLSRLGQGARHRCQRRGTMPFIPNPLCRSKSLPQPLPVPHLGHGLRYSCQCIGTRLFTLNPLRCSKGPVYLPHLGQGFRHHCQRIGTVPFILNPLCRGKSLPQCPPGTVLLFTFYKAIGNSPESPTPPFRRSGQSRVPKCLVGSAQEHHGFQGFHRHVGGPGANRGVQKAPGYHVGKSRDIALLQNTSIGSLQRGLQGLGI